MNERDRIEYLINLYGLTPSQFSDKTGIKRASVSHILSNRNKPSLEILLKIYHTFPDVELAWLVAGEGEPPTLYNESVDIQKSEDVNYIDVPKNQKTTNMLFSFMDEGVATENENKKNVAEVNISGRKESIEADVDSVGNIGVKKDIYNDADRKGAELSVDIDCNKKIKEIKVFYNNGTYETFLPEK